MGHDVAMRVLLVSASPSAESRSASLLDIVAPWLEHAGATVERLHLRTLPAGDLIAARADAAGIAPSLESLAQADGVVLSTPIYKAAYSGLLKVWLDLLPQFALTGKSVLPIATGGSLAHVLALDYALRPVLSSLGPRHIAAGWFVLDKLITRDDKGVTTLDADTTSKLHGAVESFLDLLPRT
jgi:FMN reductase